jgi:hypothetical protein
MTTLAERGLNKYGFPDQQWRSDYAHFKIWAGGHLHMVSHGQNDQGKSAASYGSIEDAVLDAYDTVKGCHEGKIPCRKHGYHGETHDMAAIDESITAQVIEQLNTNFDEMRLDAYYAQWGYKIWGGHVPAGLIMPTEGGREWQMLYVRAKDPRRLATVAQVPLTVEDFMPEWHAVSQSAMAELPLPDDLDAQKNKLIGFNARQSS